MHDLVNAMFMLTKGSSISAHKMFEQINYQINHPPPLMFFLIYFKLHFYFPAPDYWNDLGLRDIERARQNVPNVAVAKHVILFLGDGMGISTVTAARILKGKTRAVK